MDEADLVKRLARLERDNRRLKKFGAAVLVVAAILGTMAATRPIPDVIKAHTFEAVDGSGREQVRISATDVPSSPRIMLYDKAHVSDVAILGFEEGGALIGLGPERQSKAFNGEFMNDLLISDLLPGRPSIELSDPQGHRLDLGVTDTVTPAKGRMQQTSAASIVMFGNGKKHRIIWQAPQ